MLLMEVKSIFRYVYHIAPTSALPNIRRKGLLPASKSTGSQWSHIKYDQPSIFVVTRKSNDVINEILGMLSSKDNSMDDHESWTQDDWDNFLDSYVLLTIDLSKCKNVDLLKDPNTSGYQHIKVLLGVIPPESIVKVEPVAFNWD